jgi:hypothetical protein
MLTAEPTAASSARQPWAITPRVTLQGSEAHVGQAHRRERVRKMILVAEPLTQLARDLLEERTAFPMETDAARGSMLVVGGSAGGGASFNVVPGSAWFSVDRRFNPRKSSTWSSPGSSRRSKTRRHASAQTSPWTSGGIGPKGASCRATRTPTSRAAWPRRRRWPTRASWPSTLAKVMFPGGDALGRSLRTDTKGPAHEFVDEAAMRRCAAVYALFPGASAAIVPPSA